MTDEIKVVKKRGRRGGKKGKREDKGPARGNYWLRQTLEKRKVKNLMRSNGLTKEDATIFWRSVRKGRVCPNVLIRGVTDDKKH